MLIPWLKLGRAVSESRSRRELDAAVFPRMARPHTIIGDHGTKLNKMASRRQSKEGSAEWHSITPGNPYQNRFIECFDAARTTADHFSVLAVTGVSVSVSASGTRQRRTQFNTLAPHAKGDSELQRHLFGLGHVLQGIRAMPGAVMRTRSTRLVSLPDGCSITIGSARCPTSIQWRGRSRAKTTVRAQNGRYPNGADQVFSPSSYGGITSYAGTSKWQFPASPKMVPNRA